ncbi:1-phosphatidylinositol-4,5-bisphosphate phosphodiesterase 1 [Scheffersomyces xylosifermentans]|uniref:1-phosphatidylinositol-4,5-bisphosphate phosphodiesterase 1 n=1 Tax=Scheffersomyces xylosifermentans TaxID=1304137 RepID=UPI00315C7EC9
MSRQEVSGTVVGDATLGLVISSSPTDLNFSHGEVPSSVQRSSSSPISSDLPSLFSNLRTNDIKDASSSESSAKNIFKKFLHRSKSDDELPESSGRSSIFGRRLSGSKVNSHVDSNDDLYENFNNVELNPVLSRSIGQIKIPSIFLQEGLPLLKVSHKSKKRILFKINPTNFKFTWKNAYVSTTMSASNTLSRLVIPNTIHTSKAKFYEFSLDNIKTIAFQKDASNYREELHISKESEDQWVTIIYFNEKKGKMKSLHLIADSEHDFKRLSSAIKNLKNLREQLAKELFIELGDIDDSQRDIIVGKSLEGSDRSVREFLSFEDILKYSRRLNININRTFLRSIFEEVRKVNESNDIVYENGLNFDQFKLFVSTLKRRNDIIEIWNKNFGEDQKMTFEMFRDFISTVQKEEIEVSLLQRIFKKFCIDTMDYWIPENFNNFLLSKYSSPLNLISYDSDYLSHPLNEYYISSSHNTYLVGRQVAGDSSVEGYIKALQRGCRCVEVDVWDGGSIDSDDSNDSPPKEGEPIVKHGRTFTTAISFSNVMNTIRKYAFFTTPFPLVISLEVNCSIASQLKMVPILKNIFGEALVTTPIKDNATLPSPMELKHRILLKVKKTSPFYNLIALDGSYTTSTTSTTTNSFSEDNAVGRSASFSVRRKNKATKISDELSDLGVYFQGLKFRNFSLPESKSYNHCFSLSEKSINSMLKDETKRIAIDKHNRKYLMRVYPSKIRVKSSNFLPLNYWDHGVQMVATNWQTYDLGQQINEAMFEGVDRNGYVLKPSSLRKPLIKSLRKPSLPVSETHRVKFNISVISAHQLPKSKGEEKAINPFVTFEIIGASTVEWSDIRMSSGKTSIVTENGFNPCWNEEFSGVITASNDLVFVKFTILASASSIEESEVTPIGLLVAKLSYLKQGYRYLPINDLLGEELVYSSLFVKIDYSEL